MSTQEPVTQTMKISDVKSKFSSLVNEVYRREVRVLVEKSGIPVAALVSAEDLKRLDQLDRAWDERTKVLERFGAAFADQTAAEIEAQVNRIVTEGRRPDETTRDRQSA